jgi:hypothetical protein
MEMVLTEAEKTDPLVTKSMMQTPLGPRDTSHQVGHADRHRVAGDVELGFAKCPLASRLWTR